MTLMLSLRSLLQRAAVTLLCTGAVAAPLAAGLGKPAAPKVSRQWDLPALRSEMPPPAPGRTPKVRALCVGIGDYSHIPRLAGCGNDARMMAALVKDRWGGAVTRLVDGEVRIEALAAAFQSLLEGTGPGDLALLHYSGHAWPELPEWSILLPNYSAPGVPPEDTVLPASVLRRIVTALRNRGAHVLLVLDTNTSAKARLVVPGEGAEGLWRWTPGEAAPTQEEEVLLPGAGGCSAVLTLDSGSDVETGQGIYGPLSFAFATAALASPGGSFRDLALAAREVFVKHSPKGRLAFESTRPDMPLLGAPTRGAPTGPGRIELLKPAPTRGMVVTETRSVRLEGRIHPPGGASIVVAGGQTALPRPDGTFIVDLQLEPGRQRVALVAVMRDHTSVTAQVDVEVAEGIVTPGPGQRYALVIGNAAYGQGWERLETPVRDAEAVATLLRTRFGFTTELPPPREGAAPVPLLLKDATKDQILRALHALSKRTGPEDTVLVYYAGHGHSDPSVQQSYWIPVDADREFPGQWMSAEEINTWFAKFAVRHVLVVSDSCFSGNMATRDATPAKPVDPTFREEHRRYLANAMLRRSRFLLSSGANEPVADGGGGGHSVFARAFLEGLRDMEEDAFSTGELFQRLKPRVAGRSAQAPQFQQLGRSGHDGGELVFFRTDGR